MRIYHLSAARVPSNTANSIQVMRMSASLAALGHEVVLFCRPGDPAPDPYDYYAVPRSFEIVTQGWPAVRVVGSACYARRVLRAVRARTTPDLFYGRHLLSILRVRRLGVPAVAEVHEPPATVVHRALERALLRSPALERFVTNTEALRAEYLRLYPFVDPTRVVAAPNGAEPSFGLAAPRELPGRTGVPRVGYVGHLYPGKGLELIVRLASEMPHVDFHVFGGTAHDAAHWRRTASPSNLLLHAHLRPSEVPAALATFTIALAPYQYRVAVSGGNGDAAPWMSPLKLFEYMAHGKAIVASDLPVLREVLEHGVTSILCRPDDAPAWCAAIQRLIGEPALARALGERARMAVLDRYTWTHRARLVLGSARPEQLAV
jgi:glycosyltransferase involved in cell wall biosynthesis